MTATPDCFARSVVKASLMPSATYDSDGGPKARNGSTATDAVCADVEIGVAGRRMAKITMTAMTSSAAAATSLDRAAMERGGERRNSRITASIDWYRSARSLSRQRI